MPSVQHALASASLNRSPEAWTLVVNRAVGGLFAVGFEKGTESLLVVSSSGQSVFDCSTGKTIYRNRDQDGFDDE